MFASVSLNKICNLTRVVQVFAYDYAYTLPNYVPNVHLISYDFNHNRV